MFGASRSLNFIVVIVIVVLAVAIVIVVIVIAVIVAIVVEMIRCHNCILVAVPSILAVMAP